MSTTETATVTRRCACTAVVLLAPHEADALDHWGADPLCDDCNARDVAGVRAAVEDVRARETARRAAQVPAALIAAGAPERLVKACEVFEERPGQRPFREYLDLWAKDDSAAESTTTLIGEYRAGKSQLACLALGTKAARGERVAWVRAADLPAMAMGQDVAAKGRIEKLLTASRRVALVIDDIDKAHVSDFGGNLLFSLIDGQHGNGWPLLVTGNHGLEWVADNFGQHGPAIAARLGEGKVGRRLTRPEASA